MTTASVDRQIELERKDAAKEALEKGAARIESLAGSPAYVQAFKKAAKELRKLKELIG